MSDTEDLSVTIDVKCDSTKVTKTFATELVKSMNCALEKIISSINSMNSDLYRQIGDLKASMNQQIALPVRKADVAHDIATEYCTEVDQLRTEVADLKNFCKKLLAKTDTVQSQTNSMETYSRRDNITIYGIKNLRVNQRFHARRLCDSCLWISSSSRMLKLQLYHL